MDRQRWTFLLATVVLPIAGCLYTDVRAPLGYGSATPGDFGGNLGKEVTGSACNTAILWLIAVGNGGYEGAVKDALTRANASYIADVKADTQYTNVFFGLYQRQCTTISARIAMPPRRPRTKRVAVRGARCTVVVSVCVACGACQPPPIPIHAPDGTLFEGTRDAVQYRGAMIRELKVSAAPRQAYGEACKTGLYFPNYQVSPFLGSAWLVQSLDPATLAIAWGDAGIIRALADAHAQSGATVLYNVRMDSHSTSVLGIWHRDCVEVHADVLR